MKKLFNGKGWIIFRMIFILLYIMMMLWNTEYDPFKNFMNIIFILVFSMLLLMDVYDYKKKKRA